MYKTIQKEVEQEQKWCVLQTKSTERQKKKRKNLERNFALKNIII